MQPLGSSKARWAAALTAAVVVLSGLAFLVITGSSGEQNITSASTADRAITSSAKPTTTANAQTTMPTIGQPSSAGGTAPPELVAWLQGGGLQQTSGLLEESGLVLGHTNLANSCESLARNVHTAKAYKPIPDDAAQRAWTAALAGFDHGATECVTGAKANNSAQISNATKEIGVSSDALKQVMTRLSDLAR